MPSEVHEQWCKDQFDTWLANHFPRKSRDWKRGPDPPDWFLNLSGDVYAVEVSSLAWKEPCGDRDLPTDTVTSSLWSFVQSVERDAKAEGILRGCYIVDFEVAVPDFGHAKKHLEAQIRQYLLDSLDQARYNEKTLLTDGKRVGRIIKVAGSGQLLGLMGPDNSGGWPDEVKTQLSVLLDERIQDKQKRMLKFGGTLPWILVLDDQYRLAEEKVFRERVPWITEATYFHTIYVIRGSNNWLVLKTAWNSISVFP